MGHDCSSRGGDSCLMTAVCVLTQLYQNSLCQVWEFLSTNGHIQGEQATVEMERHQATSSQKLAIVVLCVEKLLAPVQQNQENPIKKNALWAILCKILYLFCKTVYCWIDAETPSVFHFLFFFNLFRSPDIWKLRFWIIFQKCKPTVFQLIFNNLIITTYSSVNEENKSY